MKLIDNAIIIHKTDNLVNSVLYEFDIKNKLVRQCYDGACVMSGHLTGLQARVKEVAPNALFTHCLAHRLNWYCNMVLV